MSVSMYRSSLDRLTRERAKLEQDLVRERDKGLRLQRDISSIVRSLTSTSSRSSFDSKQRQLQSKQQEHLRIQKKAADLETKVADKTAAIHRAAQSLERAQQQDRKKEESSDKRKRDEEIKHARAVTRETERQAQIYQQMKGGRLVIDLARLPETITVLFVASNPIDQSQLRLDEERRAIGRKIRESEYRDSVRIEASWAARPGDLLQALNEHRPHVVHFSGHGSDSDELVFQGDDGRTKLVSKDTIVTLMSTVTDNIRVVVFNACFSSSQAEAITEHVEVAIGMSTTISDEAAQIFAAAFYSAIGFGRSVHEAFGQGKVALMLAGIPEEDTPQLFTKPTIDARDVILVRPAS